MCRALPAGSPEIEAGISKEVLGHNQAVTRGRFIRSKRTPAQHVGAVMAVLGTFNEAGVLPPEADPRANQLIRSVIQFQSLFLKSPEPAVQEYLLSALSHQQGEHGARMYDLFYKKGWTSETLESLVEYSMRYSMWDNPRIKAAIESFHLSEGDWNLIEEIFLKARQELVNQGQNVHEVFVGQRQKMPGGGG